MSGEIFRLGVAQLSSGDDVAANLKTVLSLYAKAREGSAELVVFPENSLFMRIRSGTAVEGIAERGPETEALQAAVERGGVPLMVTTAVKTTGAKLNNSTLLFHPGRAPEVVYVKTHLFDVDVAGAPPVRESDHFNGGRGPATVEIGGWKFGLSICYDLRFAELYLNYAQKVDVVLIPSAFLVPTGEAHWHVLVRARAIESQVFVAAPAQSGDHLSTVAGSPVRKTYGHSLVVDPWGRVVSEQSASPDVVVVELKRELLETSRRQIPMQGHRRLARG